MYSDDRDTLRATHFRAWRKARAGEPLQPLERQIAEIAERHPEYADYLEHEEESIGRDWFPEQGETNPFLHLSLHLALVEQVTADRPPGIRALYQGMVETCGGDVHDAEHRMMECLAEEIWNSQHQQREFRAKRYLKCIKRRGGGRRPRT